LAERKRIGIKDLPAGYDPYDKELKLLLHPLADEKNFIQEKRGRAYLCCGSKIISYLAKINRKYEKALEEKGDVDEARKALNVIAHKVTESEAEEGIAISTTTITYEAGTIEDRNLMGALDRLSKMVERASKLDPNGASDVVDEINKELRAASHGKVTLSWGNRPAQQRQAKKE
jgi:hypothetical protein